LEINSSYLKNKTGFLIGAAGSGMSSLGHILLDFGVDLSGSDLKKNSAIINLEKKGFRFIGELQNLDNINFAVYSSAIDKENNQYFQFFKNKGTPLFHRSQIMHAIFDSIKSISIAGSHGKTSTTTMVAQILLQSNMNPSIMIGGETSLLQGNGGKYDTGDWGVYESDESDGTFLNHHADLKVLTNIDNDHLDFYKSSDSLKTAFQKYLFDSPYSKIIACLDDPGIYELFKDKDLSENYILYSNKEIKEKQISYSINNNSLNFIKNNVNYKVSIPIHGDHFLKNALASILTCEIIGISIESSIKILNNFSGVKRRMEFKGESQGISLFDDYGHHPTEIKVVSETLNKLKNMNARSIVVFQPHRYTRTRDHFQELGESLSSCDHIFLLPIYSAGEIPLPGINSELITKSITTNYTFLSGELDSDCKILKEFIKPGDVILTLGAGNVYEWGEFLLKIV
jgi:UDP-N-acetylmuramate--alanine ligase